jgi:hypothetical protein
VKGIKNEKKRGAAVEQQTDGAMKRNEDFNRHSTTRTQKLRTSRQFCEAEGRLVSLAGLVGQAILSPANVSASSVSL